MSKMDSFTDVSTLWYDKTEYTVSDKLNFVASKTGELHWIGNTRMRDSSPFFQQAERVCEENISATRKDIKAEYKNGIVVTEHLEMFGNVVRQYNTIENTGNDVFCIGQFSSANVNISTAGLLDWLDPERFCVHYCRASWCSETQWKKATLRELGMDYNKNFAETSHINFQSRGSWSTEKYYPLIIIEDKEKANCYFFENECGSNWEIEINKKGSCLQVDVNTCNVNHDGWNRELLPGESFQTTKAAYGMVKGGFEEAVRELNKYKRETSLVKWIDGSAKLIYNNFMGATWSDPDYRLIELIDSASEYGCEVFCIDAGWFRESGTVGFCGDYYINDQRFSPYSLEEILTYIKKRNMIPGLWFEFEACSEECDAYKMEGAMLKRNGAILGGSRGFFDMTNETVRKHLLDAVERAYNIGMRYIKNDYNNTTGIGIGDCDYNENAKKQMYAIVEFIDELRQKYPDMIIENCGSGGMRSDHFTLSHFEIQSISDQEEYINNPSILMGSLACMPVEKAGVWTYPYFVHNNAAEHNNPDQAKVRRIIRDEYEDGEKTIFNLVTGNMGAMYMSGRIDWVNEYNDALIKEGTKLYKENREFLAKSYPIYPLGMKSSGENGIAVLGLTNEAKDEILLGVWKIEDSQDTYIIDLSKYIHKKAKLEMIYPKNDTVCKYSFVPENGKLIVSLKGQPNMARLFKIIVGDEENENY